MSAIKRYMEEECDRLGEKYGYPGDMIMDALNYAEYDWDRVEYMCRARVLRWWVNYMEELERAHEEVNTKAKAEDTVCIFEDLFGIRNG